MKTTHLLSSHSSSTQNEKLWGGGGCLDRTRGLWQRECWRQLYYYQLASPVGSRQHRIHSGGRGNLIEPPPPTLWVAGDACWLGAAGVSSQVPTIFRGHVPLTQPCVPITTLITDNIGGETTEKPDGGWCLEIWESWVLQFYQRWQWDEWLLVVVVSGAWHQRCPDSNLGFSLANACPILASDWPSEWPGDHPWPRSSPVSGHSPCSEAHEAPPDTALHIARTCSTKYCPWSTGSLAGIINHIIQRNETCAFGVSTGACQSMSLVYFLPNLHAGQIAGKPGIKDA